MKRVVCLGLLVWWGAAPLRAQTTNVFRLLALEEAQDLALERNPDLAEAKTRVAEAEARLRVARAGGRPTLKARGNYEYWTEDQRLFPASRNGEPGAFGPQVFGAELVAALPLYTGGRVSGERDAAEWNRQSAVALSARARESLVFQVAAVFYGLLAQDAVVRSFEVAVRAMDEQQRVIRNLVDSGKAAQVDLLRANVRRAELYERLVREQHNRLVQQRAWAALLGLDDSDPPAARGDLQDLKMFESSVCAAADKCMREALDRRADYAAARAAVSAAEAGIRAARAGYRPTLSAQASYGARWMPDASDQPEGADAQQDVGRAGVVLEIPIFDGRLTGARVAEQTARRRGAQARLRKLELQIRFDVETALADMAAARERVRTSEQAVGQADESFRIMQEKYDLGKGTMTDVLDAQTALVVAQTTQARAMADLAIADARQKLALGEILP